MKNYKVRVESEAESNEVQDLFRELGYKKGACSTGDYPAEIIAVIDSPFIKYAYSSRASKLNHERHKSFKNLTIAELQDMVVLKRNDINDAQYVDNEGFKVYVNSGGVVYYFEHRQFNNGQHQTWVESCINYHRPESLKDDYVSELEPIEKTKQEVAMEEYLDPNANYKLFKMECSDAPHRMVKVPKGADTLVELMYVKGTFCFFKTTDKLHVWLDKNKCWEFLNCNNIKTYLGDYTVLWERNKEVKTANNLEFNIATGGQLDIIGSKICGARSRIEGETDASYREYLRSLTRFNSVEYPKDRRIEYFEKFLNGEKIQYRIGIAVGSDNSQWHNLTWNALKDMKNILIEFREAPKYVTLNGIEFKSVESLLKHVKNKYDLGD